MSPKAEKLGSTLENKEYTASRRLAACWEHSKVPHGLKAKRYLGSSRYIVSSPDEGNVFILILNYWKAVVN